MFFFFNYCSEICLTMQSSSVSEYCYFRRWHVECKPNSQNGSLFRFGCFLTPAWWIEAIRDESCSCGLSTVTVKQKHSFVTSFIIPLACIFTCLGQKLKVKPSNFQLALIKLRCLLKHIPQAYGPKYIWFDCVASCVRWWLVYRNMLVM